jgi:hypothetical protein
VLPKTKKIVSDCLVMDDEVRPLFDEMAIRLKEMRFQSMAGVDPSKVP